MFCAGNKSALSVLMPVLTRSTYPITLLTVDDIRKRVEQACVNQSLVICCCRLVAPMLKINSFFWIKMSLGAGCLTVVESAFLWLYLFSFFFLLNYAICLILSSISSINTSMRNSCISSTFVLLWPGRSTKSMHSLQMRNLSCEHWQRSIIEFVYLCACEALTAVIGKLLWPDLTTLRSLQVLNWQKCHHGSVPPQSYKCSWVNS